MVKHSNYFLSLQSNSFSSSIWRDINLLLLSLFPSLTLNALTYPCLNVFILGNGNKKTKTDGIMK